MRKLFAVVIGLGLAALVPSVPAVAKEHTIKGSCSLTVDGKLVLNIKKTCRIDFIDDAGSFIINGDQKGSGIFAYLNKYDDGTADASWNETRASTHAQAPLGEDFVQRGGCWVGRRAKVCAFK